LQLQLQLPACDAADIQQIIHQAHQVSHLSLHHGDRSLRDFIVSADALV
jgi:hypothetical protein